MKKYIVLLFISIFCTLHVTAQLTFTIAPNPLRFTTSVSETTMEAYTKVTNRDARPDTLRWSRRVISITPGCETQVCDPVACYAPFVDTRTFPLAGNETVNFGVWLQNPERRAASAVVRMLLTNVSNTRDSATAVFLFSPNVSTGEPLPEATVRVHPNPVSTGFYLNNAANVQRLRILTLDGRLISHQPALPEGTFYTPLADQPRGSYILVLEDKLGRAFQAIELVH
jgi:hypothetical protein